MQNSSQARGEVQKGRRAKERTRFAFQPQRGSWVSFLVLFCFSPCYLAGCLIEVTEEPRIHEIASYNLSQYLLVFVIFCHLLLF